MPGNYSSQDNTHPSPNIGLVFTSLLAEIALFFCAILCVFIWYLAPEITANDAGELAAAAYELGIAHPPGFPVFLLVDNFFMNVVGVGEFGFRANFASAFTAALALAMAMWTVRTRGGHRLVTWMLGIFTAFSPLFAVHAVTVEVYASAAFIVLIAVECLLRYLESNDQRYAYALAIILGLGGLAHHPLLRLVGLCFAPFVLAKCGFKNGLKLFAVSIVAGLLTCSYLPIRSLLLPERDWGSPRTLTTIFDHLSGKRIRQSYSEEIGTFDADAFALLAEQWIWSSSGLCLLVLGMVFWIAKDKLLRILGSLYVVDVAYSALVNPMGLADYQNGWLSTALLFPISAIICTKLAEASSGRQHFLLGILCFFVGYQTFRYHTSENFSEASPWYQSVSQVSGVAAPESLIMTASDSASSTWAFLHVVENARPDMASIVRQHVFRDSSVGPVHRRRPNALSGWKSGASLTDLKHISSGWPLLWEWADGRDMQSRPTLTQQVFPFHGLQQIAVPSRIAQWQVGNPHPGWSQYSDFVRGQSLADSSFAALSGRPGSQSLEAAVKWAPSDSIMQQRYTAHLTKEGRLKTAEKAVLEALHHLPGDEQLVEQLVRIYLGQKRFEVAVNLTLKIQASNQNIQANLFGLKAVGLANLGRYPEAIQACKEALKLNPKQVEAVVTLPRLQALTE